MTPADSLHLTPDQEQRLLQLESLIEEHSRDEDSPEHLAITDHYLADCAELPPAARQLLLDRLCARFIEAQMPISVFVPFLFADPDERIAAEAVHRVARFWAGGAYSSGEFATQMREDLAFLTSTGDAVRAVTLLHSLLMLGDRRLVVRLHGTWRLFGRTGRRRLCRRLSRCAQAPVLEWMTSWLEEAGLGGEARDVAGSLARNGRHRRNDVVYELRRADDTTGEFTIHRHWVRAHFGARLAKRWRQLSAELAPVSLFSAWSQRAR